MAARTIEAAAHQWELVADAVHHRRTALGLSAKQVAELAGPGLSVAVLSLIENARQVSYTVRTMTALCRALGWTSDSIDRILAGKEPRLASTGWPAGEPIEDRLARLEAELAALRAQLEAERATRSEPA